MSNLNNNYDFYKQIFWDWGKINNNNNNLLTQNKLEFAPIQKLLYHLPPKLDNNNNNNDFKMPFYYFFTNNYCKLFF